MYKLVGKDVVDSQGPCFQYKDAILSYLTGVGNSHVKGKTVARTSFLEHEVAHTGETGSL